MKQSLAAVLSGFQALGSDESRERPVDRLAAMGAIQIGASRTSLIASLGVDLIAFKFGGRTQSQVTAEALLAEILAWPSWMLDVTDEERPRIARWAVREWALDKCPPRPNGCGGAKEVPSHDQREGAQPMQPCPRCSGTGQYRYSDSERVAVLGEAFSKAMGVAHGIIGRSEDLAVRGGIEMLERWRVI